MANGKIKSEYLMPIHFNEDCSKMTQDFIFSLFFGFNCVFLGNLEESGVDPLVKVSPNYLSV
jgi:hypothetical protein